MFWCNLNYFGFVSRIDDLVTLPLRCSEWGPHRSRGAAAAAPALQPGPGGAGHPGGHGLEQQGGGVLQGPELHRQPPAQAEAERRHRG